MKDKNIEALLNWYSKNKRDLPWRHTKDSYKIWISEIMLQQTRVEAVKEYYKRFLNTLPTLESLAKVDDDILLKLWEGLGYYSRARNLKKCANEVLARGLFELPRDEKEIRDLPGIGPYTAGAILSIAYHQCTPAIDGNVMRILSRIFEDDRNLLKSSVREEYTSLLRKFMRPQISRQFTESFIELGALVCLPNGKPKCEECPFQNVCKAYKHQTTLQYPVKKEKTKRKVVEKTVYILEYQKNYAIQKREEDGLLRGLYEFPNIDNSFTVDELGKYLSSISYFYEEIYFLGDFKHIFSHIEWHMKGYLVKLSKPSKKDTFYKKEEIEQLYSLPTAFQKIFRKVKP